MDVRRKERSEIRDAKSPSADKDSKKDLILGKRPAETSESEVEPKKPCLSKEPPLEDDLSEISDDADEILNRDEEIAEIATEDPTLDSERVSCKDGAQQPSASSSQKSQSPNRTPNQAGKEESIEEENIDLDFEEISEDELDEESRVKGLGDALGVDWASLVAESRPRVKPVSSAKRRWESHNVLVNLGISVDMAGETLVKDILREHAEAKSKDEQESKEIEETNKETVVTNGDKENGEVKESVVKKEVAEVVISHPIAAIQVAVRENAQARKNLFANAGLYSRALCARRDLAIRRHLSHLPIDDTYVEPPKRHDPDLLNQALQLFERSL